MRILFDVNHAAHVHFVKNAYRILTAEGHDCQISASDKPLVYKLLEENNLPYYPMGKIGKSLFAKFFLLLVHDLRLLLYCLRNRPEAILGIVAIRGSHVGALLGIRSFVFTDTEGAPMQIAIFKPFATQIHTPNWFNKELGKKQVRYKGFHELAYLHPNYFKPNVEVLDLLGVSEDETYFMLRFVAWDATHDMNESGLSLEGKRSIINLLKPHGRVFISSEYELEDEFKSMEYTVPFTLMHDAMYYSSMVITEGTTTACEAAVLGIPSICINSNYLGYLDYLEKEYELVHHYFKEAEAIDTIRELLLKDNYQEEWALRREEFIFSQIDTTEYIISLLKSGVSKSSPSDEKQ